MPRYGHLHLLPPQERDEMAGAKRRIRVVLADGHPAVRRSLRLLLDREDELEVVGDAGDLATTVRYVDEHRPDILVLDHQMHDGSSNETISFLRTRVPKTAIVLLTMETSAAFAWHAIDAGAIGFVLKDRADSDLPAALRAATRGDEFVSPPVAATLKAMRDAPGKRP
jgi:two-component system response regulator NreC